jgi:hypothetical protein
MNDDRELTELAAKAAGIKIEWVSTRLDENFIARIRNENPYWFNWPAWNPLNDDGDALRLAVKLGINLEIGEVGLGDVQAGKRDDWACEWLSADDPCAAVRRAIVRAAATMAKTTA